MAPQTRPRSRAASPRWPSGGGRRMGTRTPSSPSARRAGSTPSRSGMPRSIASSRRWSRSTGTSMRCTASSTVRSISISVRSAVDLLLPEPGSGRTRGGGPLPHQDRLLRAPQLPGRHPGRAARAGAGVEPSPLGAVALHGRFAERIPASLIQRMGQVMRQADLYIAEYNIHGPPPNEGRS